jgi:hypothetical protein
VAGAQSLFERALAIEEKMLGPEHPDTNRSRYHLGSEKAACWADARWSGFCEARLLFLRNHRAAASSFIHSASSFALKPYAACRLRKS